MDIDTTTNKRNGADSVERLVEMEDTKPRCGMSTNHTENTIVRPKMLMLMAADALDGSDETTPTLT